MNISLLDTPNFHSQRRMKPGELSQTLYNGLSKTYRVCMSSLLFFKNFPKKRNPVLKCALLDNDPSRALPISDVETFAPTAPPPPSPSPKQKVKENEPQPPAYSNPQTEAFCRMLGITNKINTGHFVKEE